MYGRTHFHLYVLRHRHIVFLVVDYSVNTPVLAPKHHPNQGHGCENVLLHETKYSTTLYKNE